MNIDAILELKAETEKAIAHVNSCVAKLNAEGFGVAPGKNETIFIFRQTVESYGERLEAPAPQAAPELNLVPKTTECSNGAACHA